MPGRGMCEVGGKLPHFSPRTSEKIYTTRTALLTSEGNINGDNFLVYNTFTEKIWTVETRKTTFTKQFVRMRFSFRLAYLFLYNLLQFCGHTWILANMTARFLSFGKDALVDTFYSVGVVMSLCQLLSMLELFHLADGIEKGRLLPRFIQVMERNFLLFVVIINQEEFQSKSIVCVLFYLWNTLDLFRYTHGLLRLISTPSPGMLWVRHTMSIPVYLLSVIAEGVSIYQALPYFEAQGTYSVQLKDPVLVYIHFPNVLMAYLPLLASGACLAVWQLLKERKHGLEGRGRKQKRS